MKLNPLNTMIANLAAATILHDDPELNDWVAMDSYDRARLVRDYRDEFASSEFPPLADYRLDTEMEDAIVAILDAIAIM